MALDSGGGGDSSPFVHIKKAPAVVEGEVLSADMDVVADEEVWSEPATAVARAVVVGSGDGAPAEMVGAAEEAVGERGEAGGGTGAAAVVLDEGDGVSKAEGLLPYVVLVTDNAGTVTKGAGAKVSFYFCRSKSRVLVSRACAVGGVCVPRYAHGMLGTDGFFFAWNLLCLPIRKRADLLTRYIFPMNMYLSK